MRKFFMLFFALVALNTGLKGQNTYPTEILLNNGTPSKRINLVFMAEGYQASEMTKFIADVTVLVNGLFAQTPFKEYKSFFNVYAIKVPSSQSGADHAHSAADCPNLATHPISDVSTYFDSQYDAYGIHRLLVPYNATNVDLVAAANVPQYDQIFVLVNSNFYGGSGGTHATASTNAASAEIAIHEIGHSFGELADEYWAGAQYAAEKANMTQNNNSTSIKWKNWLNSNGIGAYQHAGQPWYKPHQNCKMQSLGSPFCSVCVEALLNKLYTLTSPLDTYSPNNNSVAATGSALSFSVTTVQPAPNTVTIQWFLNGALLPNNATTACTINPNQLLAGNNSLEVRLTDNTTLSRSFLPATGYVFGTTWVIVNPAQTLPLEFLSFTAERTPNQKVFLEWTTVNEENTAYFEIERSQNGKEFVPLGRVQARNMPKETLFYNFIDRSPFLSESYYRIRQLDKDENVTYSTIQSIDKINKLLYKVFPNPTPDFVYINYQINRDTEIQAQIFDQAGKKVFQSVPKLEVAGENLLELDLRPLPVGAYSVRLLLDGRVVTERVVKL